VCRVSAVAARGSHLVEDLERQIDAMIGEPPSSPTKKVVRRRLDLTEQNVGRLFGVSMWELFQALAGKFGYVIEGDPPPKS